MIGNIQQAPEALKFTLHDTDGQRIRPGDHKGTPDDAKIVEIVINNAEREMNDLLHDTNGLLRALAQALGIDDDLINKHKSPRLVSNRDELADNCFKLVKFKAEASVRKVNRVNVSDLVLREARVMLREYVRAMRAVKPTVNSAPGIYLANEWTICYYLLVSERFNSKGKLEATVRWQKAQHEFMKLLAT